MHIKLIIKYEKNIYICCYVGLMIILTFACTKEFSNHDKQEFNNNTFTIEEARTFFESQIAHSVGRSGSDEKPRGLTPGEFAPQWDKAVVSENEKIGSVDIPVNSQYKYRAIRSEFKNGKAKAYTVEVSQKLVIVKDKSNERIGQYILTLIPDKDYYSKNKGDISDKFLNSGDKGKFSGVAIYSIPNMEFVVRVDRYEDGRIVRGIYLPNEDREQYLANIVYAKKITGEFLMQYRVQSLSRSYG